MPADNPLPKPTSSACVLACSGCSPAGELADRTARRLQTQNVARMSCLAGIGGRIPSILAAVRKASDILMIDGCPLECGANALRLAGINTFKHLRLHELGVRKNDAAVVDEERVRQLTGAAVCCLEALDANREA